MARAPPSRVAVRVVSVFMVCPVRWRAWPASSATAVVWNPEQSTSARAAVPMRGRINLIVEWVM
jgi:hypothetical protein